jgi:serine/threonine-protein kinase
VFCPACHSDYPPDWKVCPKDATNLLKTPQIGKYTIEGMLGQGGMGAVYRAINPDTKGRVAIKVMNPSVASADSARQRFQREAAAVAALRTAHVCKVYDFGSEPDGTLFLVMELLDGHTLRDEITPAPDSMDLARVQMVMDGALRGLAAAHKAGIVHRDLKPENIFIADTDDGEVPKLLDFGIARVRTRDSDLTRTGSLMGTASYMATEQVVPNVGEIGPWTDVYAMGAILHEMLSGAPAFGGTTVTEVLQRVMRAERVPLQTVRAGLPEGIYALVERCLSSQPAQRPQDAEALRIAVSAARLVPLGTTIPPRGGPASPGSSQVGLAATEGRGTPMPVIADSKPLASRPNDGPAGPVPGPSVTPVPTPVETTPARPEPAPEPTKKASRWPLAVGGVAVLGIGAVVAVKAMSGGGEPAARDAAVAMPVVIDAPHVVATVADAPAPPVDAAPTEGMIHFAAGTYDVGEDGKPSADALPRTRVQVGELWIDRLEVTVADVKRALPELVVGKDFGLAGDGDAMPARSIAWVKAREVCEKLGKRLPSELEWEIAALTAPQDAAKATLQTGAPKLVASRGTDCAASGLCDMLGSVAEWTDDTIKDRHVARGGSYKVAPSEKWLASIHARALVPPAADDEIGFRCAIGGKAEVVKVAPAKPKPTEPPKPAEPAKPDCAKVDELIERAKSAAAGERWAEALPDAEAALTCKPNNTNMHRIAALAGCNLGKAAVVAAHLAGVGGPGHRAVREACERHGVPLP